MMRHDPELIKAYAANRRALSAVKVHDRMETLRTISGICARLEQRGEAYETEARLAVAYALDDVLTTDAEEVAELEAECGLDSEYGHIFCANRDAFKRSRGLI